MGLMAGLKRACLVRGSINLDECLNVERLPLPGETIYSHKYCRRHGGKGANGAVAIAKAGGSVAFSGVLGLDGEALRDALHSHGVKVAGLGCSPDLPTGRAIIQVSGQTGQNSIVLVAGANHAPDHQWPPLLLPKDTYSHILLQNEIPIGQTAAALLKAHQQGIQTIFNPSPLPSPSEIQNDFDWGAVDWLVVNEEEAQRLSEVARSVRTQKTVPISVEPSPEAVEFARVLSDLIQRSFANDAVVVTLGHRGCMVGFREPGDSPHWKAFHSPPGQGKGPVVDTSGAGDCFTGFLVSELMTILPGSTSLERIKSAVGFAGVAARLCVEKHGTLDSYPSREEVLKQVDEEKAPLKWGTST